MKLDQSALTIYQAKSNKNVIILSTLHTTVTVDQEKKKKPETITFYTETEYGVDILDQMAKKYSIIAGSRRWPVHIFYNILDLAVIKCMDYL